LARQGRQVPLQDQPARVLSLLASRPQELVTREELRRALWSEDTFVQFEAALNVAINKVRQALGDSAATPRYIETVPRHGYRFLADVRRVAESGPLEASVDAAAGGDSDAEARRTNRRALVRGPWAIGAAAVLALAGLAAVMIARGVERRGRPPAPQRLQTLAVLPFRTLPPADPPDLLELGLPDVLIARLSHLRDVRVLPLTASERVRQLDPVEAGRALGASAVLVGSLQRDQGRLRASVRLLDVRDGTASWSATLDVEDRGVFAAQDAIVERVIDTLAPRLAAETRARVERAGTASREAFEAYLKGRAHLRRLGPSDSERGLASLRGALAIDPRFADAWGGLGFALAQLPFVDDARPRDVFPEAEAAARRALEIDPDNATALGTLARVAFYYEWDEDEAERAIRRAIELQPSSPELHLYRGHMLSQLGRGDEAVLEARRARELDPGWRIAGALEGQYLALARRYPEAVAALDAVLELEPAYWQAHVMRAYPLLELGRFEEARASCDEAYLLSGGHSYALTLKGYALARLGRDAEAEAVLRQLQDRSRERYVPPHHLALLSRALGDTTASFAHLERAVQERDVYLTFLGVDPKWDDLRGDPRFDGLLARLHLSGLHDR
jgi:DNA-binding winged helix-turn-helix (wHTH) protein/TolB-like protein/Tfp pilus assembly protein PilF